VLTKLFEPGYIGKMKLKNRIIMPTMATWYANIWGEVTDTMINFYSRRAKGGAGLITMEGILSIPPEKPVRMLTLNVSPMPINNPKFFELTEAVHAFDGKIAAELAPVPVMALLARQSFDKFSTEDIEKIVKGFGMVAMMAKSVGFDAIEIASAVMMEYFWSPHLNKRTDKYGGDLDGRLRFTQEIIQSARGAVGADFPILFRFSIEQYIKGGRELKDSQIIAKKLEEWGVDAIHTMAGSEMSTHRDIMPLYLPKAATAHLAEGIKKVVKIPVIASGRLGDPATAEAVLREGRADFVSIGRGLIADPDLPRKAHAGKLNEIRKCISCNVGCYENTKNFLPLRCTINPVAGREGLYDELKPAEKIKKVVVVGAGPGGMEAARVAALRGHRVTLYEKTAELGGGQFKLSMMPPHKEELRNIIDYYSAQFKNLRNLKLALGVEATSELIKKQLPDAVIIATGAQPIVPNIPGVSGSNVTGFSDVLLGKVSVGDRVAVVGGGAIGCETANFIAAKGKKVTVIEMLHEVAINVEPLTKVCLLQELAERKVEILTDTKTEEITSGGVRTVDKSGKKMLLEVDTVVIAVGTKPVNALENELWGEVDELYTIGDAKEPRKMINAIHEGFEAANRL
jgi:2,4-dienoyl-CoA reductase-like NADH-dependent reductase (Old Yellow Enzyme family)/thioredoxin reductase